MPASRIKSDTTTSVLTLTHSSKSLFQNCQRRFFYSYEKLLTPIVQSTALVAGSIVHAGLADLMKGAPVEKAIQTVRAQISKARKQTFEDPTEFENTATYLEGMVKGWASNRGYLKGVKAWTWDGDPAVEIPFSVKCKDDLLFEGVMDAVVRMKDGLWLVEHKTTGTLDQAYLKRLPIDAQVTAYVWAMRQLLPEKPVGVIYNVLRKPSIRQKEKESVSQYQQRLLKDFVIRPAFYFHQVKLYRDDAFIDEFESSLRFLAEDVRRARTRGVWLKNESHCTRYGICPFLPICENGQRRDVMMAYRKREKLNVEVDGE